MIEIKKSKYKIIKQKSRDILLSCSMHGIHGIVKESNYLVKLVWVICLLISMASCAYFIFTSILNYLNYEVVTQISTIYEGQSEFPSISICASKGKLNQDSIKDCTFNTNDCNSEFEFFLDKYFGKCLRFNSGINLSNQSTDILYSNVAGIDFGLTFDILAKDSNEYTELAVFIHNKSLSPYILANKGFRISSGSINYFMMERIFDEKLESPYNDCYKNIDDFDQNKTIINFLKETKNSYTQTECIRYCRNLYNMETSGCNCVISIDSSYNCTKSDNKIIKNCFNNFMRTFQKLNVFEICSKYCPLECDSSSFQVYINTERLPTTGNISITTNINSFSNKYLNFYKTYEDLQKRFFRIIIYYSDLKYIYIKQEPKTLIADLVSNIGGTFGLFLGISFLSLIEFVEIIIETLSVITNFRNN